MVLLGDAATGKSSLLIRFTTGVFNPQLDSTIGAAFKSKYLKHSVNQCRVITVNNKTYRLDIWDTAGQVGSSMYDSSKGALSFNLTNVL